MLAAEFDGSGPTLERHACDGKVGQPLGRPWANMEYKPNPLGASAVLQPSSCDVCAAHQR